MQNNGIEMTVHVNGRSVKEYTHQGMSFIEARDGTNYTIKLKNNTGNRTMVVVSVDGLDVVSGKNAAETDTGYIIDAYDTIEIKGYRISDNDSAAFVFTGKGKSYVQNVKGDAQNCGVIGVRAFREKELVNVVTLPYISSATYTTVPYTVQPVTYTSNTNPNLINATCDSWSAASVPTSYNCYVNSSAPIRNLSTLNVLRSTNFDTGTGWGQKQEDKVKRVSFDKGVMVCEMTMYYASKDALVEMGVEVKPKKQVGMPQAFGNYCTPPKGWNGY